MQGPSRHFVPSALATGGIVAIGLLLLAQATRPLAGDVFWVLIGGRALLQMGHLPTSDPLTYASHVASYVDAQWLAQLAF
jgi:hypothetical protein